LSNLIDRKGKIDELATPAVRTPSSKINGLSWSAGVFCTIERVTEFSELDSMAVTP
jgi:hypothetical protein